MGRTSKNIKLRIPEKPHKIKGFRSGSYRIATTISSQGRYNHFDTAPYCSDIISNTEQKIKPGFFKICLYNSFNFLYISLDKFAEWVYYILKK